MPFDPEAYIAGKPQPEAAPFDPEAYITGKPQPEAAAGAAAGGPGLISRAVRSVAADLPRIAGETLESRQFESALSGVMEGGMSPDEAAQMAPVPPTQPEHGGFARGAVTTMMKENPGAAADFLEGFSTAAPEAYKGALTSAAQKVRDFSKNVTPKGYERLTNSMYDIKGLGDAWNWLTETSGSMVASTVPPVVLGGAGALAGGVIGGPVGAVVGGTAGVFGTSYVQNYGEVYNALKDAGLDTKIAHNYAGWGTIPIAALDAGSLEFLVSRFGGVQAAKKALIDSFVKRVVKTGAETGGVEAGTEAAQEAIKDAVVSVSPADKPFLTLENLKGILESGVTGLVGGASMGGPAGVFHAPARIRPKLSEQDIAAAGAGITTEIPPVAAPTQGELPLGPPQVLTPAQQAASAAAIVNYAGKIATGELSHPNDGVAEPMMVPEGARGRSMGDAVNSEILASGPLETRPSTIDITSEMVPAATPRPETVTGAAEAAPQLSVALKAETAKVSNILDSKLLGQVVNLKATQTRPTISLNTLHSTTLGNILPHVSMGQQGSVMRALSQALTQRLATTIPDMPVHFILDRDMEKASPGAGGVYYSSPEGMGRPISQQGPILIAASEMATPARFSQVLLHESTHAVTSNILRKDPVLVRRVRLLMHEALKHYHAASKARDLLGAELKSFTADQGSPRSGIAEKELQTLVEKGLLPYAFTNEREFLAEAFARVEFQDALLKMATPRELAQELGLEGRPKLWDSFVEAIRQALGLPPGYQMKSLLDAVIRVGGETITAQEREVAAMQAKFNSIEPMLRAVPRQDATAGAYNVLKGLKDHIEPDNQAEMSRQVGYADKMNWFYKLMIHAYQLGELNPHIAPLQRILEKARFASTEEAAINDAALRVMKDWVNLGRGMSEKLTSLIDDITNMVYRTQSEIQRGIGRKPTQQEFNILVRKHGVNQDALNVLTKINKMFDKFLDLSSDLARNEAMKITDLNAKIAALTEINQNVTNLKSKPYFPFMRYGRHVVLVRNQAGRVVHREHFERRGIYSAEYFQNKARAKLEQAFPAPQYKVELDILSESSKPMIGMPGIMLDLMQQKLGLTTSQLKALEQLRYELSPAQSYKHRFQHKSYTKGYSQDFQRSFSQYFFHGMKWYVKTKYADEMKANIKEIKDSAMTSLTPQKRIKIGLFMEDWLQKGFLDPTQDFIAFKAGLVFFTLAYVPASAAINMSQVPMVAYPHLAGKFGPVQAFAALSKAIGTPRNYYRKGGLASMTSDEARALDYAIKTGRLEQTLAMELASWAQGSNLGVGYGGTKIQRGLHGMVEKGMWMFSIAEKWNRRVTFAAARELALAQPNNKYVQEILPSYRDELAKMMREGFSQHEAEAILVASHVVNQTHFMSGPDSRPKFMRGKLGSLFLYKRYIQGLLFLTLNNKRDTGLGFLIIAMAMGGLGGIPGYEDLGEIARVLAYQLFGKDFSVDREIRRLMRAMGAEDHAADQVLHGSARMGFGVPWLLNLLASAAGQSPTVNVQRGYPSGPDLSRSIGAGPILPVELGKLLGPPINDPSKMFGEQSARAGGVMGQLAFNFYRAIESKDPADFKRWELLMPRFAKDLSQVYRAYSTGKLAGKNDTTIVQFDTRDPEHLGELVGMAGGFQPRRLTARYEELRNQSEEIKFYDTQRSMLLEQWATAIRSNNPDEREKMRVATQEFNASLPVAARGFSLSRDTIQHSVAQRLRSQQMMEAGFAAQRGRIPLIQEMQKLHPESAVDVRSFGPNTIDATRR